MKGDFIEYVVSNNPNKYPNDGEQSGYYWECVGKPMISFTIDRTSYQAEEGMTWGEFVASSYNPGGFIIFSNGKVGIGNRYVADEQVTVASDDTIKPNYIYSYVSAGSAN